MIRRFSPSVLIVGSVVAAGVLVAAPPASAQNATTRPATAAAATQPALGLLGPRRPTPAFISNAEQREDQRRMIQEAEDGGTGRIPDLIRFGVVEGRLESEWVGKSTNRKDRRMRMEGSDATWLVKHVPTTTGAFYSIARYQFGGPEEDFWTVNLNTQEGLGDTRMIAQGGESCDLVSLAFMQTSSGVSLMLNERRTNRRPTLRAADLAELRRNHPNETSRYLLPLLRSMTGQPILRPGAGDVYRAFADIPADPAVTRQIEELLPALAAADAADRERAIAALAALGRPGALAALRYDLEFLVPEQRTNLQNLVAKHTVLGLDDPSRATSDVNFLVECLEDEDLRVRTKAREMLERTVGRPVAFDPSAPPDARAAVATAIRIELAQIASTLNRPDDKPRPQ